MGVNLLIMTIMSLEKTCEDTVDQIVDLQSGLLQESNRSEGFCMT